MKGRIMWVLVVLGLVLLLAGCDPQGPGGLTSTPPVSPTAPLSSATAITAPTPTDTPTPVPPPPPPTPSASALQVVGITMTVAPAILSNYRCGSWVTVDYAAHFLFNEGNAGGVVTFRYTSDNGRSSWEGRIRVSPGVTKDTYHFYWSGKLPSDHTAPGLAGIIVLSPTEMRSGTIEPAGVCYG